MSKLLPVPDNDHLGNPLNVSLPDFNLKRHKQKQLQTEELYLEQAKTEWKLKESAAQENMLRAKYIRNVS